MISLDQNLALGLRYPGFRSFKAAQAIHYRHRFCRIVLVLDTLDEQVAELAAADSELSARGAGSDLIYRRKIGDRWETVGLVSGSGKDCKMKIDRVLTREQILALPGAENARMIWAKRNTTVTLAVRMTVLELTANNRLTTLGKLLHATTNALGSAAELLALIADGTLQIDARAELSTSTPVRRRTATA